MPVERGNPNVFKVFKGRFECEVDPEATTSRLVLPDYRALYQQGVVRR